LVLIIGKGAAPPQIFAHAGE